METSTPKITDDQLMLILGKDMRCFSKASLFNRIMALRCASAGLSWGLFRTHEKSTKAIPFQYDLQGLKTYWLSRIADLRLEMYSVTWDQISPDVQLATIDGLTRCIQNAMQFYQTASKQMEHCMDIFTPPHPIAMREIISNDEIKENTDALCQAAWKDFTEALGKKK